MSIKCNDMKKFIAFVLSKYIETGVGELDQTKLPVLLSSMFQSEADGIAELGGDVMKIRNLFISRSIFIKRDKEPVYNNQYAQHLVVF